MSMQDTIGATADFLNVRAKLGLVFEEPKEEGEIDMCKTTEMRISSKRMNERENTLVKNIKNLMETLKFTAEQAMNALKVSASDQARLAGLL